MERMEGPRDAEEECTARVYPPHALGESALVAATWGGLEDAGMAPGVTARGGAGAIRHAGADVVVSFHALPTCRS